jgi:hypothetical protein
LTFQITLTEPPPAVNEGEGAESRRGKSRRGEGEKGRRGEGEKGRRGDSPNTVADGSPPLPLFVSILYRSAIAISLRGGKNRIRSLERIWASVY